MRQGTWRLWIALAAAIILATLLLQPAFKGVGWPVENLFERRCLWRVAPS
jgi:hypothetical protein